MEVRINIKCDGRQAGSASERRCREDKNKRENKKGTYESSSSASIGH
jgi:hypothetical protein